MAAAEQKKSYKVIKAFKGVNTKANRTSIDEEEFSWLENAQPVGASNLKVTNNRSTVYDSGNTAVTFGNVVTSLTSYNINNQDYIFAPQADGRIEYYNIATATKGNVAVTGTFSGSGVSITQWKNERVLIVDSDKGYYTWDATNLVFVGSVGPVAFTNVGSGYTSAPTVTISAPNNTGGVQAQAQATVANGTITSVTITNAGSGYTSAPTVTVSGGGGSGANAVAGLITFATGTVSVLVTNPGTGYINAANTVVTIGNVTGWTTQATATAILSGGQVQQVVMTNPGAGYTNSSNVVVTISGGGGSNATATAVVNTQQNSAIATFSGRVWISFGRTIAYSAASSYSDFTSVSAGSLTITDSTLHSNIYQLLAANNFLYIFGDDSINVFSDVRVQSDGSTIFTNTNVSASVGTKRPMTIFPYFRSVLFMNDYGVYALVGSTTTKISDALDGLFPSIDFSYPATAGQVLLNNILCAAFNFQQSYNETTQNTPRFIQAVFFDKKWFFTSQGNTLNYIASVPVGGVTTLYGTDGNALYRLYTNTTGNVSSTVQTALMAMGDPIRDKQALKIGIEGTLTIGGNLTATVDSESASSPPYTLTGITTWTNNSGATISWLNNSNVQVPWLYGGFILFKTDAQQWGKYLGQTVTATVPGLTYHGFEFEHELRARF